MIQSYSHFRIDNHQNEDDIQPRIPEPDQQLSSGALLGHGQQQQFHPCCLQRSGPGGRDFVFFFFNDGLGCLLRINVIYEIWNVFYQIKICLQNLLFFFKHNLSQDIKDK
jgi:hypothetical protein